MLKLELLIRIARVCWFTSVFSTFVLKTDRCNNIFMMRAIGFVVALYAISQIMSGAFTAFENAIVATFETVQVAAVISKHHLIDEAN